jgi:DNA-binding winged helix-turn-helix (wHTH) protein
MNKSHYSVNGWLLDRNNSAIVHLGFGETKRLGEYQFKLLVCLVEHAGQPLSRNELTALVWHRRVIGDNSLSNAIHALRVALEDDGKQQRVIKTIPKKGYVLEAEFCAMVDASAAEVPDAPQEASAAPAVLPPSPPVLHAAPVATPPKLPTKSGWRAIPRRLIAAVLVGLLLLGGGWLYARHIADSDIVYKEQVKNRWSNIRVFRVAVASDDINDEEIMKIKTALDKLNQHLIGLDTGMTIYYRTTEQMLNYTFTVTSTCNSRQLAMTLYHWRIDSQKLSDLIFRETQRKIDEMAPCKKP